MAFRLAKRDFFAHLLFRPSFFGVVFRGLLRNLIVCIPFRKALKFFADFLLFLPFEKSSILSRFWRPLCVHGFSARS